MNYLLLKSDARTLPLADKSVHCVVTSPPYYGLRDYGIGGQIGLEASPEEWVATMVGVFREVKKVLRDDGTIFVNIGDSYCAQQGNGFNTHACTGGTNRVQDMQKQCGDIKVATGLPPKNLLGMPWRLAFALQADGWYLRADLIWHKPNPMPESVRDRPTKAHEYIFLLTKRERYFYDGDAVREGATCAGANTERKTAGAMEQAQDPLRFRTRPVGRTCGYPQARNSRSVWTIPSHPFKGAHFATMPLKLAAKCIKAGTSKRGVCAKCGAPWERVVERESKQAQAAWSGAGRQNGCPAGGGHEGRTGQWTADSKTLGWRPACQCQAPAIPAVVFDPFAGAGSTVVAALALGRSAIGLDLNPKYLTMAKRRIERPHAPMREPKPDESPGPLFARMT